MGNKMICFALAALLLLSLSACGKGEETPSESAVVPPVTASPEYTHDPSTDVTQPPATPTTSTTPTSQPTVEPTDDPGVEPTPEQPPVTAPPVNTGDGIDTDSPALLGETEDMGQAYIDKIIFLGDSTTYGLKYYEVLSGGEETEQVWTPASGTLTLSYQGFATIVYPPTGEEIPIRDAVERAKPEMMVITLGVNGVSFMDEEYFISEYTALVTDIQTISPDTKIILQSIFPIASNYEYQGDINNTNISAANRWVLSVAEATGVKYLNTYSALIGDDGFLPQDYQNGDGLHLNETSFNIVLNYIRTHGYN